ncbi:VOC family protein [Georgenia sp. SYP-B2076]|uniref:VOC family protein n=1 Tax=Georgenia sp. SYP-B2076 TaxID=2495881 RepID=UPI000F8D76DC|nr:VOC family protein [Georgenia sp. SYP-B2076]
MIKIATTSVFVSDQHKAHTFYTEVLGFETRMNVPVGEHLWLTVGAVGAQHDVSLLLEPGDSEIAKNYTTALYAAGLPVMVFSVDDIHAEYERLTGLGVAFTQEPTAHGPVITAILDDTVGNLLQLAQYVEHPEM